MTPRRTGRRAWFAAWVLAAIWLPGVTLAPPLGEIPSASAEEPDLADTAADLIEDAKAALELARGFARRADDVNLGYSERSTARKSAMDLLKTAREKLNGAVQLEAARERQVDPIMKETMELLAWVRKSSGIGEGADGGAAPKSAPVPKDDRPPTPREDAPAAPAPAPGNPGTGGGTVTPPPTAPELTVIAFEEWDRQYREIAGRANLTTAARLDALRALARGKAIEFRGKIEDVLPAPKYGEGATMIRLCGVYGGSPARAFVVAAADRATVLSWQRWDRVAWRERIDVLDVDRVEYRPVFRTPADLVRTPGPGVEYPRDVRTIDTAATWQSNLRKFAEPIMMNKWRTAYGALRRAASREYEIPGAVEQVTADGAMVRPKGNQALESRDGRRFGPARGTVPVTITDPQVKAAVAVGTPVTLTFTLEIPPSVRALYDARGEVTYRWKFHRLRDPAAK